MDVIVIKAWVRWYFVCLYQNDEVSLQRKVRTEVIQLEDTLAQVRKEYEMLRIEFEQTLAANEQAGKLLLLSL